MVLLFLASALHQAALLSDDKGESLQALKALLVSLTRDLQSSFHHGLLGSALALGSGFRLRKCLVLEAIISLLKVKSAKLESDIERKETSLRAFDKSVFHGSHFFSSRIQAGDLLVDLVGVAFRIEMTGRWSLPIKGPTEIVAPRASREDVKIRWMVEALPLDRSTLVPKSKGVSKRVLMIQEDLCHCSSTSINGALTFPEIVVRIEVACHNEQIGTIKHKLDIFWITVSFWHINREKVNTAIFCGSDSCTDSFNGD